MTPAEVPAELVEKAVPEVLALFEVCALDSTEKPNAACVYCRDDAEALTRAALAAVLPEIQAQALRDAADHWQTREWANVPRRADRVADRLGAAQHVCNWLRERAARLSAMTGEPTT